MHKRIYVILVCALMMFVSESSASAAEYNATTAGQHALALSSGSGSYNNITVTKTGDVSGQNDDYDWKGTNAAVHASGKAVLTITGSSTTIKSDAAYGNAVFSYGGNLNGNNAGDGTTINISDATITTSKNNSGGIMATGGGKITASNLTITTSGGSSAAIRSDKGGGTISVTGGTYTTNGQGSPAIYSTAAITGSGVTLKTTKSQGVVIEGGNSVTLKDSSTITAAHTTKNGQDTTYQAVLIYQSQSGDAANGTSAFSMTGGTITNANGDIFLATNTTCTITLSGVSITNNDSSGYFLRAAAQNWGSSGKNGGKVTFNASDQTISGNILIDNASTLTMNLTESSDFTGAVNTSGKAGTVRVTVASGSSWTLTADSYISSLSNSGTITLGSYKLYVNGEEYNGTSETAGTDDDSPSITTETLKNATVGKSYSMSLSASGTKPMMWTSTALPDGLSLSSAGRISGKPTASAGSYDVTFTATNNAGSDSETFTMNVLDVKPTIKATVKNAVVDMAYSLPFTASSGTGTITWALTGDLPEGLSFDADTAVLGGVPTESFSDYLTVTATNTGGTAAKKFKLTVKAMKPTVSTKSIPTGL